jgi:hypothetical protein
MMMKMENILDYIGWTFLIITVILLKVGERLLDNVIQAKSFVFEYSMYGLLLSLTVLYLMYKLQPGYFKNGTEKRASAVLSYFFGLVAIFVFGSAKYNLETSKKDTKTIHALVMERDENYLYKTPYVKLNIKGHTERFQPTKSEWENISVNDSLTLTVGKGRLGFLQILRFTKNGPQTISI